MWLNEESEEKRRVFKEAEKDGEARHARRFVRMESARFNHRKKRKHTTRPFSYRLDLPGKHLSNAVTTHSVLHNLLLDRRLRKGPSGACDCAGPRVELITTAGPKALSYNPCAPTSSIKN